MAKRAEQKTTDGGGVAQAAVELNKAYGENFIMRLGDKPRAKIDVISTGSLKLDLALGVGGLPRGRVVEIYGPPSSGKTTLALHVVANAQKAGGTCAYIDAEHALDTEYGERIGVKIKDLYISQPDCGEMALEAVDTLLRNGGVSVIVVDSVAALTPRAELEGEMGDSLPGLHARLMSQGLRKITGKCAKSNTLVIFINQIRYKIGVMYGSPETTTGGNALPFYASVRLDVRRRKPITNGEEQIGNETEVRVLKNKVAPPFKKAEFEFLYDRGINREGEIIDGAVNFGIIEKRGAWYSYDGVQIGQGLPNVTQYLRDNKDVAEAIEKKVLKEIYGS